MSEKLNKSLSNYCNEMKTSKHKAIVIYITAGIENWKEAIAVCIDNGADIIEIGLPFSDPTMDGPIIAQASYRSIENGSHTLELLAELSELKFKRPLVVMTYMNILYSHGLDLAIQSCNDANISGLIIPDLTYEESFLLDETLNDTDISHIQLISSTTNDVRKEEILDKSEGFLYTIALKGITGQEVSFDEEIIEFFKDIELNTIQPSYCGIGIRTAEQAKEISQYCDGIIVGSSIVAKLMNKPNDLDDIGKFVSDLRQAIDSSSLA